MQKEDQVVFDSRPIQPSGPVVYAVPVYPTAPSSLEQQQFVSHSIATALPAAHATRVVAAIPQATLVSVVQTNQFGAQPARVICQFCGADVVTGVKVTVSFRRHCCYLKIFLKKCFY